MERIIVLCGAKLKAVTVNTAFWTWRTVLWRAFPCPHFGSFPQWCDMGIPVSNSGSDTVMDRRSVSCHVQVECDKCILDFANTTPPPLLKNENPIEMCERMLLWRFNCHSSAHGKLNSEHHKKNSHHPKVLMKNNWNLGIFFLSEIHIPFSVI